MTTTYNDYEPLTLDELGAENAVAIEQPNTEPTIDEAVQSARWQFWEQIRADFPGRSHDVPSELGDRLAKAMTEAVTEWLAMADDDDEDFPETCEDRGYRCCETLTREEHEAQHGYAGDSYADDEPSEPEEGDITTSDHKEFYQYGKLWLGLTGEFTTAEMNAAIRDKMHREQFYPAVWFISDHGNAHLMTLTD